jgi:prepilin-type N-terminal cleavage/methylation domain-containing protein
MKINIKPSIRPRQSSGFTLIEMIGVLAVIAILAAVLVPKVFQAISDARINNAAMAINSIKGAVIDHYAKYGSFPVDGSAPGTPVALLPAQQLVFDTILLKEGLIDKPFAVKIGDGLPEDATHTRIQIVQAQTAATAADGVNGAYNLDGDATATPANDASGTWVVEAVITGVATADAEALNKAIDGLTTTLGPAAAGAKDVGGRVEYVAPAAGITEVHVYLTHR